MVIDKPLAEQWLPNVGYYRLSAYWHPARKISSDGESLLDEFESGTSFNDVVDLYESDRKLRTLIHDGIERIEIAMRAQLTDYLCLNPVNDPQAYLSGERFRPTFNHLEWMSAIYGRMNRASRRSEAITHYSTEYGGQYPLWVIAECMDFKDISKLYSGLYSSEQRNIADRIGLSFDLQDLSKNNKEKVQDRHPWANWMEQLTIVRNTAAHHGRMWNRSFVPATTVALRTKPAFANLPPKQSERIFGTLIVMSHVLRIVSPGTTWPSKVAHLLDQSFLTNPLVQFSSLGIPDTWDRKTL
ncbi:Abi family protein [Corynebacterium sp.]|uniref:Abi family protein n=1 Tax=Corynebacterium sp. TaxID=1720 RepID=UPI0026DBD380|nr:Abi family protein [Corynebacterium sp.]MDO4915972.1 Abi family protein [Corynebacterium sp.]